MPGSGFSVFPVIPASVSPPPPKAASQGDSTHGVPGMSVISREASGRLSPLPSWLASVHPSLLALPFPELFSLLSQVPFLFLLVSPVSMCVCAQCVFTVTKAHFQTPTPVVTDTLRVPMAGLAFSHQVSPLWEEGDSMSCIFLF